MLRRSKSLLGYLGGFSVELLLLVNNKRHFIMNLQIFSSNSSQAEALFTNILDNIKELQKNKQDIVIALSGGKSPIPLLEKLSHANIDFSNITFTLVDERIVAPNDPDSNENLLKTYLLKNNAKNAKFVGLVNMNLPEEQMIANLNKQITNIDLAVLGMGEDGHTASIFPCCSELNQALNDKNNYIVTNPKKAKYSRITLTLNTIVNIPVLILSIDGNTKLNVLKEANKGDNLNYPISFILNKRQDTQIFWYE